MIFRVSLLVASLSVLILVFLRPEEGGSKAEKVSVPVKTWMEYHSQEPGGLVLRFQGKTESVTCYNRNPDGSYSVILSGAGRKKFANPDDVNSAIAGAIDAAQDQLRLKDGIICTEQCLSIQGYGNDTVGACGASATITLGGFRRFDRLCDPNGITGDTPAMVALEISGPSRAGWDLTNFYENLAPSVIDAPGETWEQNWTDAVPRWIENAILSGNSPPSSGTSSVPYTMYPEVFIAASMAYGGAVPVDEVEINLVADPPYSSGLTMGCNYSTSVPFNPTVTTSYTMTKVDGTETYSYWKDVFPGSFTLVWRPAITVNLTVGIPLAPPDFTIPDDWTHEDVTASGTFSWGLSADFPIVYNTVDCEVNLYYVAQDDPLIREDNMCVNDLHLKITPDTIIPKGMSPKCVLRSYGIPVPPEEET